VNKQEWTDHFINAVHSYSDARERNLHGCSPEEDKEESALADKMLEAAREWARSDDCCDGWTYVDSKYLAEVEAKAAVCESVLDDEVYIAHGSIETRDAIARLLELQEKAP